MISPTRVHFALEIRDCDFLIKCTKTVKLYRPDNGLLALHCSSVTDVGVSPLADRTAQHRNGSTRPAEYRTSNTTVKWQLRLLLFVRLTKVTVTTSSSIRPFLPPLDIVCPSRRLATSGKRVSMVGGDHLRSDGSLAPLSLECSEVTTVEENAPDAEAAPEGEASEDAAAAAEAEAAARAARAQASIKEREREVQRALATSLRDRDKEREYHKRDEAVQHFNALLADLVRNPDLTWREAKKQLKKDHRYNLAELLPKEDKERLFSQHTAALCGRRRDKMRELLAELGVSATAHWRDVKRTLKDEPRTPKYASPEKVPLVGGPTARSLCPFVINRNVGDDDTARTVQMEREFREYQREKQGATRAALRQLLQETRSVTHKTRAAVKDNPAALQQLHDALKADARYTALEHIPEEREQIIMSYLEELEKKGPPPPPTATEPTRRSKHVVPFSVLDFQSERSNSPSKMHSRSNRDRAWGLRPYKSRDPRPFGQTLERTGGHFRQFAFVVNEVPQ
ncbi:Transcription elongation regulator 1 [Eumeta japonica]|uniref:Transcription elongation regulator 1 n=1 Tax=Eumeta variegata TaxID=151549 RepID=A0A4C1UMF8_EUMVA|nr:Transcription elongation regulator 1 [Eumeta japonica]